MGGQAIVGCLAATGLADAKWRELWGMVMSRFPVIITGLICLLATALCLPSPAWSASTSKKQGDLLLMYFAAGDTKRVFNLYRIKDRETLEYITGLAIIKSYKGAWHTIAGPKYEIVAEKLWGVDPSNIKNTIEKLQVETGVPATKAEGVWGPASWNYFYEYARKLNNPSVIDFNKRKILVLNLDSIANHLKKYLGDAFSENKKEWKIDHTVFYQALPASTRQAIYAFADLDGQSQGAPAAAAAATADLQKLKQQNQQLKQERDSLKAALAATRANTGTAERLDAESRELRQINSHQKRELERLTQEKTNLQAQLTQAAKGDPQKATLQILANVQGLSGRVDALSQKVDALPRNVTGGIAPGQGGDVTIPWTKLIFTIVLLVAAVNTLLFLLLRRHSERKSDQPNIVFETLNHQFKYLREVFPQQTQQIQESTRQAIEAQLADKGNSEGLFDKLRQLMAQINLRLAQLNQRLPVQDHESAPEPDPAWDQMRQEVERLARQVEDLKSQLAERSPAGSTPLREKPELAGPINSGQVQGPAVKNEPQDPVLLNAPRTNTSPLPTTTSPQEARKDDGSPSRGKDGVEVAGKAPLPAGEGRSGQASQKLTPPAAPSRASKPVDRKIPSALAQDATLQDAVIALREGMRAEMEALAKDIVSSKFNTRVMGTYNKVADAMDLLRNFFRPWERQGEELRALNASLVGHLLEAWQTFRKDVVVAHPAAEKLFTDTEESRSKLANVLKGVKAGNYQARVDEKLSEWRSAVSNGYQEGEVVQDRQNEELEKALVAFVRKHVLPFVDKWSVDKLENQPQFEDLKTLGITAKGFINLLGEVKQKCGLEYSEPILWGPFDRELHKAVEHRTLKGSHNQVAEVLQPGVRMYLGEAGSKGRSELLRQAKVVMTVRG